MIDESLWESTPASGELNGLNFSKKVDATGLGAQAFHPARHGAACADACADVRNLTIARG